MLRPALGALALLAACSSGPSAAPEAVGRAAAEPGLAAVPDTLDVIAARVDSEDAAFRVVRVVGGLQNPWAMAFLPDGRLLVTERPGRLLLVDGGRATPVAGTPEVAARGQGGLLDVALHPRFEDNRLVYLTYATGDGRGLGTRLARARLADDARALDDLEVLYTLPQLSNAGQHFGSRLAFLPDGTLLMTIGDRGQMDRAQDRADAAGATLRFSDDGSVPPDNPFVGEPGVRPELYTYGNRNSQGMAVEPGTGRVWQTEHGPRGGDELNVIRPGRNYGWPEVSLGADYVTRRPIGQRPPAPGVEDAVTHWTPSIAPSGLAFYAGDAFPAWRGNLFAGALAHRQVRRIVLDGERVVRQEILLEGLLGRIRDVRVGPDGLVYVATDENPGGVYRLEPVGAGQAQQR
ncbi:MAG: PQQ-dependent sugar dehydrogenase [Rubricoccaceae bacterium]